MGTSFTTTHIHNAQNLTKAQFNKAFTDMMKAKGYTASDEENAALTYTLAFSLDRKWVTVLTDEDDTRREAAEFAKALKMHTVMIDLVDSDFAELSLFDEAGAHKDTLTLGDSYLEDAAPMGDTAAWQPLLCGSWEQVQEIQNGSYTFAEDALAQFAPLIGMNSGNILLDNDSADDNAVVLHFKKAAEKKLTLNSAFVKYFGELLTPYGFVKKSINKLPMFIRVINNEILQIVTYRQISSRKVGYSTFEIYSNIMTLYRDIPDPTMKPERYLHKMRFSKNGVMTLGEELVKRAIEYNVLLMQDKEIVWNDIPKDRYEWYLEDGLWRVGFHYSPDFHTGMVIARDIAEKILLPAFASTKTLEQCIDYFYSHDEEMRFYDYDEETRAFSDAESFNILPYYHTSEALTLIVADYRKDATQYTEKQLEQLVKDINGESGVKRGLEGAKDIDDYKARFRKRAQMETELRNLILDTPELKEKALTAAKDIQKKNMDILRSYGVME